MSEQSNSDRPLSELIEKIMSKGAIDAEDQAQINALVLSGAAASSENAGLAALTDMVIKGRISVQ